MPAGFARRIVRRLGVVGVCALSGSCYYLPPEIVPVHPDTAPDKLLGVTDLPSAPDSNRIRILFIHGMGVHPGCDADELLFHLTKTLRVTPQPPPAIDPSETCAHFALPMPTPIPAANAQHTALLYRYDLAGAGRQVTFMYLRWSTLTDVPKQTLDEPGHPHRAILSDAAKDFEQQKLTDVVLYGGLYREVVRPAVERGLCLFVEGTPDPTDPRLCKDGQTGIPTAVITHSLAGYMLMDAMSDIYEHAPTATASGEHNAAGKVGSYLDQIFMLANQLKMLDLSTKTSEGQSSQIVERFRKAWDATRSQRPHPERRQVLAISDPNDILSWEVTKSEFERSGVTVANVYLGTTGEFLGLYRLPIWGLAASPVTAHTNYLVDNDVMDIIACGMAGSTILRCAP